jgi:hypothetical protein
MTHNMVFATAVSLLVWGCHDRVVSGGTGPACLGPVSVSASMTGVTQLPVELKAQSKWSDAVAAASGQTYGHWDLAHARDMTCKHDKAVIRTWTCTATAEPCES